MSPKAIRAPSLPRPLVRCAADPVDFSICDPQTVRLPWTYGAILAGVLCTGRGQCPLTYHQTWGREGPTGFLHIKRQERWVVFQLVAPCTDGRFETPLCSVTRVLHCEVSVKRGKTALRNRGTHLEG